MRWKPGQPVVTASDVAEWEDWKRQVARERQRTRRRSLRRIDYETNEATKSFLEYLRHRYGPVGLSALLDAIVARWGASWQAGREPDLW